MRLREKKTKDTPVDAEDQEDEMYSDEDELYPSTPMPEIITRGPFIQRERDFFGPQTLSSVLTSLMLWHKALQTFLRHLAMSSNQMLPF